MCSAAARSFASYDSSLQCRLKHRTLTPFGFQGEERTFWDAADTYIAMSPFANASKIAKPILLLHGADDQNTGTYPMQSERLFAGMATRVVHATSLGQESMRPAVRFRFDWPYYAKYAITAHIGWLTLCPAAAQRSRAWGRRRGLCCCRTNSTTTAPERASSTCLPSRATGSGGTLAPAGQRARQSSGNAFP
jgi:hypothetical protein